MIEHYKMTYSETASSYRKYKKEQLIHLVADLTNDNRALVETIENKNKTIAELRKSIENDTFCAYCGQKYPRGTPKSQNAALTEHIKVCPKHPMREVEVVIAKLTDKISRYNSIFVDIYSLARDGESDEGTIDYAKLNCNKIKGIADEAMVNLRLEAEHDQQ